MHAHILNICIAMAPLKLPNYVMLEIIDWLPHYYHGVSHQRKIALIESISRTIRKNGVFATKTRTRRRL